MGDLDAELHGHQRARQCRVNVADNYHPIRLFFDRDRFERLHNRGRLLRMAARPNPEIYIRRRHSQVAEEGLRHCFVIMLPGMHQKRLELVVAPLHRRDNGRYLHEVGPSARDDDDLEH